MATMVITTAVGAILNAATFIGGSYFAKKLSGKDLDEERKRHDLAVEKYEKDYNAWKERMANLQAWREQREKEEYQAGEDFQSTNAAFQAYAKTHPNDQGSIEEPEFSDYYTPSKDQKNGKMLFAGLATGGIV